MPLVVDVHAEPRGGKRISLAGSLDTGTAQQLQDKVDESVDATVHLLILDLRRLEFLSSAGLRVIFKTKKLMDSRDGGKFLLVNLQPQVRKVFDIIKALDGMDVFRNQEEMDEYLAEMQNRVRGGEET